MSQTETDKHSSDMDNELFGEMHEQEENGLYGERHERELLGKDPHKCFCDSDVRCCGCNAPLDNMEQEENAKVTDKKEDYRCYYCFRQNALDDDEIGWL